MKSKNLILNHTVIVALLPCLLIAAARAQETPTEPKTTNGAFAAALGVPVQPTSFTYQGRLNETGGAANGTFDFQFALFIDSMGGTAIGTVAKTGVAVANGIFTVELDFGLGAFPDEIRWLEIRVKSQAAAEYTPLSPRQKITNSPLALRAARATLAENAQNAFAIGSTPAAQIIKEGDARLTDSRAPAAGSANYIQNQNSSAQASANFNIEGKGAANIFDAQTQYNIGGARAFKVDTRDNNLFVGRNTGTANSYGYYNVFVGENTGQSNTTGHSNSFVGYDAGFANTVGDANAFFGQNTGHLNTDGNYNSFFGDSAGYANTSGNGNTFLGRSAEETNETGGNNTFVGKEAGYYSTGADNTFVGANAGFNNGSGSKNTAVGESSIVSGGLTFATVIGAGASVSTSNSVVLGRSADTVRIPGNLNLSGSFSGNFAVPAANVTGTLNATQIPNLDASKITAGTFDAARIPDLSASYVRNQTALQASTSFNISGNGTAGGTLSANTLNAQTQFNIGGYRILSVAGTENIFVGKNTGTGNATGGLNSFFGENAGQANISGGSNSFLGFNAGYSNMAGSFNLFAGRNAGLSNTTGNYNTVIGSYADVAANNLIFATAIGSNSLVTQSDTIVLGKNAGTYGGVARPADTVQIPGDLKVVGNLTSNGNVKLGASGNLFAASGEENLKIVRGHISVAGGNATVLSGSGYTVTRHSTGVFTITFTTPFSSDVVLTPSLISSNFNAPMTATITEINNGTSVRINVFNPSGVLSDPSSLLFIAVGVH
jgi:hypothetical protein